jgi:hypothetical protein
MDDIIEPRTHLNMIRDLLAFAEEHKWVEGTGGCGRGCCTTTYVRCPECHADQGSYHKNRETYRKHEPGCKLAALILECTTYLEVEDALALEREYADG